MEEEYYKRIDDNFLKADYVDGEVLQHTDLNELENVVKTAVNANYEDIQKLRNGTYQVGDSKKLDGATLSKYDTETLQASDTKVPTSMQVKEYVDTEISHIDLDGYYTKRETDDLLDDKQNVLYTEIVDRTEDNPFNFNTCDPGLYYIDNSFAIVGEVTWDLTHDQGDAHSSTLAVTNYMYDGVYYRLLTFSEGRVYRIDRTGENSYEINWYYSDSFITPGWIKDNGYVKSTDYASSSKGGVIKTRRTNGISISGTGNDGGYLTADIASYDYYLEQHGTYFIGKGTLENVIAGKGLLTLADLTSNGYVKNTDYATNSKGGVIKLSNTTKTKVDANGVLGADTITYPYYEAASNDMFISKGTLNNVISGELTKRDDYATKVKGGTFRLDDDSATYIEYHQPTDPDASKNGILRTQVKTYADYTSGLNSMFIGKGTLENVITGKGLIDNTVNNLTNYYTKTEIDIMIGDIDSVLDAINGEVI